MIKIDDSLLEEIGLITLPKEERDQLLRQIYETLEMRVGMRLAERMSDQQLDEFERFIDTNDEAGALKWLETNFPDYKQVVASELEKLKGEIKQDSTKIMEAMQAGANTAGQPTAQQQPQMQSMNPAPQPFNPTPVQPQQAFNSNPVQPQQFAQPHMPSQPVPGSFPQPQTQQPQQSVQPQTQDDSSQTQQSSQPQDDQTAQGYQNIPPPPSF